MCLYCLLPRITVIVLVFKVMSGKKCISNVNCCVYECHTKKGRERNLSFHRFPKETSGYVYLTNKYGLQEKVNKKKAWEKVLLMGKPATVHMRVCSLHFTKENFILPDFPTRIPRLKQDAVPSQNLPQKSIVSPHPSSSRNKRCNRTRKPVNEENKENEEHFENRVADRPTSRKLENLGETEKVALSGLLQLVNFPPPNKKTEERATQVTSGDILVPFISAIDSDSKLNSLTGLHSFKLLDAIVIMFNRHFPEARIKKLTVKEQIILTFVKIKTGLRYVVLAALFGVITSKTCKVVFHSTISKLAVILKPLIFWPTKDEIKKNLPICFREFSNVRVVLDCTELSVQRAKCLCCRIKTYSHYKGGQTIKFMTGVTPGGLISFVSKAYGGRASDKAIFEQSGLIDKLEMGQDALMVDKGFRIEDIAETHFIKLIRPPFLKKRKQLTEQESKRNIEIAKARVHIERTNQRIKMFEIFCKPLPWTVVPKIEDIFNVVCAIVNLSPAILSDDKFLK